MALISIVVPLYNKESSILKTVKSVLSQTFSDFELIIVNDGSTDNSWSIVSSIDDSRIILFDKINEGVSVSRNFGATKATTDLLFFLDADDYIYPHCLETLMRLRDDFPYALLWSANFENVTKDAVSTVLYEQNRGYVIDAVKKRWLRQWDLRSGSYVCSKRAFVEIGGFPSNICVGEDELMIDNFVSSFLCAYDPRVVMSYLFEYRSQSKLILHPSKHLEYNINFRELDGYRKLRFGELLGVSLLYYTKIFSLHFVALLIKKQWKNIPFSFYALYRRVCRKISNNRDTGN